MSRSAKVRLRWIGTPPERASTPGWSFSTAAQFAHQGDDDESWSIVISTESPPDAYGEQSAIASFLMPAAPQHWLAVGNRFTLLGRGPVAEVCIEAIVPCEGKAT